MTEKSETIAALLREREACEARGLTERVAAINDELRRLGAKAQLRGNIEQRPARAVIEAVETR